MRISTQDRPRAVASQGGDTGGLHDLFYDVKSRPLMRALLILLVAACGSAGAAADGPGIDHVDDPTLPAGDAGTFDAAADAIVQRDAAPPPPPGPVATWARYTIAPGAHGALVTTAGAGDPASGIVSGISGRDYDLALDPSAAYTITSLVEPNDQLDWNKLPGLSDCGTVDLSQDGVMFGWRWRIDTTPKVLEITAYANGAGKHLTPPAPLFVLDAADLASVTPLRYRISVDGALYRFAVSGTMRGRAIDVTASLARRCAATAPSSLPVQWAAGLYFGGTSTAPATITSRIFERTPF